MITVLRGLPGSGKSTWARGWVFDAPVGERVVVSRDDIRAMITREDRKQVLSRELEEVISQVEETAVRAGVLAGKEVVIDAMHLKNSYCVRWVKLGLELGVNVSFMMFDVDVDECVRRDAVRGFSGVGDEAIRGIAGRFLKKGKIPKVLMPKEEEGAIRPYVQQGDLPEAILVDIDGTVALNTGGRGWFDWARVGEDSRNEAVCEIVQTLIYGSEDGSPEIIFLSGRSDECFDETMEWLEWNFDLPEDGVKLFMREAGDYRKDSVVKSEIFWNEIAPRWDVLACIDDRKQVVDMWRSMGLTVFQVDEGNF